jgi:hypothetical protein
MDFYKICVKENKDGSVDIYPHFKVGRSSDLMIRGKTFYAVWDEAKHIWSTDEYDVVRLVDQDLENYAQEHFSNGNIQYKVRYMRDFNNNSWVQFRRWMQNLSDNYTELDSSLTWINTPVTKTDYISKRLPYPLEAGDTGAWDEMIGTLYSVDERKKIEWTIGAIVSGDSKKIQKFSVLYGPAGTGKSTILNVVMMLFEGYTATFESKALGTGSTFATESFKSNPLVAIQHDGDLSKIEDNTKLNSIVSHEEMQMNEKYKPSYSSRVNAYLLMGTNQPVKISDAKSGIIRRLIDIRPTGVKIPATRYNVLMTQITFELGAIAHKCLHIYNAMGKHYYDGYRPLEMMLQTDVFYNYIEAHYDVFKGQEYTTIKQAYILYKEFCADTGINFVMPQYKFREELRNYFDNFHDRIVINGERFRSVYSGFNASKFKTPADTESGYALVMDETKSILDVYLSEQPAQYSTEEGTPKQKWAKVKTTLKDLDTNEQHFVKVPENHIVIDFDLKDEHGRKDLGRNLKAASEWPPTYGELSRGGNGVHLHYHYSGDSGRLSGTYSEGIEVKVLSGNASLRRKLSSCNKIPIATINGGLPLKEEKMLDELTIKSEQGLRDMINRNLRKEIHPGTKPSIDFINKILNDAFDSGLPYDLSDMKPRIISFAAKSTNQANNCLRLVKDMKFASEDGDGGKIDPETKTLVFFDIEVYPNLFVICWKYSGSEEVKEMINPAPTDVEALFVHPLVGFNNRRYDNHILYAAAMGYTNQQLYALSQKIINGDRNALFGSAYDISYADVYDFSSVKQSLKKHQVDLGIFHMEMDIPWDEDVPEEKVAKVVEYCKNDVVSTEKVFYARYADYVARQILSALSGLPINDTTQKHAAKIVFGGQHGYKDEFVYTRLEEEFPGYEFEQGKSSYLGENPSEGGYVYAEPGAYKNVAVLDVASMHPTSIVQLNLFGKYTKNFEDLMDARLAIKRNDYDAAREMLGGKLVPYLSDPSAAKELGYALKIVINIVYGLTSAKFDNPFRDVRNIDNIVAKRGALFMIDLKHFVQEKLGKQVVHIKTDSIKIPEPSVEDILAIQEFGMKYGYEFEHEATYDRFCLVNDAVYIANEKGCWDAVGAQFAHPYVFKTLFSNDDLTFDDYCETKQVTQGSIYIQHDLEKSMVQSGPEAWRDWKFVGRIGRFVPVEEGTGGGLLWRVKDGKAYAVTGTKNWFWKEAEVAHQLPETTAVEMAYFKDLQSKAVKAIEQYIPFDEFVN